MISQMARRKKARVLARNLNQDEWEKKSNFFFYRTINTYKGLYKLKIYYFCNKYAKTSFNCINFFIVV